MVQHVMAATLTQDSQHYTATERNICSMCEAIVCIKKIWQLEDPMEPPLSQNSNLSLIFGLEVTLLDFWMILKNDLFSKGILP